MSERRYSQDSQSSGPEAQNRRKHKFGIKVGAIKDRQLPFQTLSAVQIQQQLSGQVKLNQQNLESARVNLNNSVLSYTEASDSDSSTQSRSVNESEVEKRKKQLQKFQKEPMVNPIDVKPKKYYHKYAERQNTCQELKQSLEIILETLYGIIVFDIFCNIILLIWKLIENFLVIFFTLPILLVEFIRRICYKMKKSALAKKKSINSFFKVDTQSKGDLQIVLDLDQTLVYSTILKPALSDKNFIELNLAEAGGKIFVYKRPYLDQFLNELANYGDISVFTASVQSYADPIIDEIDPKGIIKRRFYRNNCKLNKNGQPQKNMKEVTSNMRKLLIIDDSDDTYQANKKNTIKITQWSKDIRNDKALLDCLDIIEQLRFSDDVSKDLKFIIDTNLQLN